MGNATAEVAAILATVFSHFLVGTAIGAMTGFFGRTAAGLAAVVVVFLAMMGMTDACVGVLGKAVDCVRPDEVGAFLTTAAGMSALAGFIAGFYVALRSAR